MDREVSPEAGTHTGGFCFVGPRDEERAEEAPPGLSTVSTPSSLLLPSFPTWSCLWTSPPNSCSRPAPPLPKAVPSADNGRTRGVSCSLLELAESLQAQRHAPPCLHRTARSCTEDLYLEPPITVFPAEGQKQIRLARTGTHTQPFPQGRHPISLSFPLPIPLSAIHSFTQQTLVQCLFCAKYKA